MELITTILVVIVAPIRIKTSRVGENERGRREKESKHEDRQALRKETPYHDGLQGERIQSGGSVRVMGVVVSIGTRPHPGKARILAYSTGAVSSHCLKRWLNAARLPKRD